MSRFQGVPRGPDVDILLGGSLSGLMSTIPHSGPSSTSDCSKVRFSRRQSAVKPENDRAFSSVVKQRLSS